MYKIIKVIEDNDIMYNPEDIMKFYLRVINKYLC